MKKSLEVLVERMLPDAYKESSTDRTNASILVCVVPFNLVFTALSLLYLEFFINEVATLDAFTLMSGRFIVYFTIVTYLISLFYFFIPQKLTAACQVTIFALFGSCFMGIMITGGYTGSPLTALLVITPVFAFVLLGLRVGIIWSALSMLSWFSLWTLEFYGIYTPIQVINNDIVARSLALAVPVSVGMMVIAGLVIYEMITIKLRNELKAERNKFQWDATHDALTGLPNRPEFFHRLQLAIRNADVNEQELALVYFDLDGFKPVNDNLGHHAGDIVLRVISERLKSTLRGSDTVARVGGDEFALILNAIKKDEKILDAILQKTLKSISESMIIEGKEVSVGASLGVVFYQGSDTPDSLCRKADEAMYKAKEQKNTWCMYSS